MGKDNVRIFFCQCLACIHVAPACREDNLASFLDTLAHCCLDGSLIIVRYVVLADNLIILQTNGFLHRYDTLIMRIAVTGTIRRISNMNHSDLQILFSNCRHHALCCLACFCVCRVSSLFLRCLRICCIRRRRRTACTQGQRHGSAQ